MRFYTKRRKMPSITIVSLIDILAILLIFFIVTTTFKDKLPQLQINLPESKSAATAASEPKKAVILQIKGPDQITLDGKAVTPAGIPAAIRDVQKANPGCTITMQADKEAWSPCSTRFRKQASRMSPRSPAPPQNKPPR